MCCLLKLWRYRSLNETQVHIAAARIQNKDIAHTLSLSSLIFGRNRYACSGCDCREKFFRGRDWNGVGHIVGFVPGDETAYFRVNCGVVLYGIFKILEIRRKRKIDSIMLNIRAAGA